MPVNAALVEKGLISLFKTQNTWNWFPWHQALSHPLSFKVLVFVFSKHRFEYLTLLKTLQNIKRTGCRLPTLGEGALGSLFLICHAVSSPCTHSFNHPLWWLVRWTYYIFFSGLYSYWALHSPYNFTLLKSPCFLPRRLFWSLPFDRIYCTLYTTGLNWFNHFIYNHIHVYFPLRSLKARSIHPAFMCINPTRKPLESVLHIVGTKS